MPPHGINDFGTDMNNSVDNKLNDDGSSEKHKVLHPMTYLSMGQVQQSQNLPIENASLTGELGQPLLGGGQGYGQPPYMIGNEPQTRNEIIYGNNQGPLKIESLEEFYLGPRDDLRVTVTKPGDLSRGLLDYGTITGPQNITFTGFIAAVRHQHQTIFELALDSGTLTQPDGRVFTGNFSIIFPEGSVL